MIYHFKDNLQNLTYRLKTPLKYSDDFTFIPIKINNDDILFQTPSFIYSLWRSNKRKV